MEEDGNRNLGLESSMEKGKNTIVVAIYAMNRYGRMELKFLKNNFSNNKGFDHHS